MAWRLKVSQTCLCPHQVTQSQIEILGHMGPALGGCPKSLGSSAQNCSQEPVASRFCLLGVVGGEVHFTSVSLGSLKVTCLLSLTRLDEAAHLQPGSSGQSTGEAICPL